MLQMLNLLQLELGNNPLPPWDGFRNCLFICLSKVIVLPRALFFLVQTQPHVDGLRLLIGHR